MYNTALALCIRYSAVNAPTTRGTVTRLDRRLTEIAEQAAIQGRVVGKAVVAAAVEAVLVAAHPPDHHRRPLLERNLP